MTASAIEYAGRAGLAARFVDAPHVSAPDAAGQRLTEWLGDCEPDQARAIAELIAAHPKLEAILLGIVESSPYLFDLIRADAARVLRLLSCACCPMLAVLLSLLSLGGAASRPRWSY